MDITDIIRKAKRYRKLDESKFHEAYNIALKAHAGQTRMSGEPYIVHPLAVADILTDYHGDEESIITALLHDVVEDSHYNPKEIEKTFGKSIMSMVIALTKLPRALENGSKKFGQYNVKIESIRKMFEVMQNDVRVIVIKLCDRLHNMRTLYHFRPEKQKRIAQETFNIYVKIADRLSILDLKERLEELSFKYLFPIKYDAIQSTLRARNDVFRKNKRSTLEKINSNPLLKKATDILIRQRVDYTDIAYKDFDNSVIINEVVLTLHRTDDCFLALKEIHSFWKNIRGSFRDYITVPKSNGYQALESSIIKKESTIIKFIIQTPQMYEYSRYGVVLECFSRSKSGKKISLPWVENLKRITKETKEKSVDYLSALENDILKGAIVVYSQDNKAIQIPLKSTALDAAFFYLGKSSYRLSEVFINGKKAYFSSPLYDFDTVNFILRKDQTFAYDWLHQINTGYASSFIYEKIRSLSHPKRTEIGRRLLQDELFQLKKGYVAEISGIKKSQVAKELGYKNWTDLLISLSSGDVNNDQIISLLFKDASSDSRSNQYLLDLYRDEMSFRSMIDLFEYFKHSGLEAKHLTTKLINKVYNDRFLILCSFNELRSLVAKIKPYYLGIDIREYNPLRKKYLFLQLLVLILIWTANPFIIKFSLNEGLTPINVSAFRMIVAAVVLFGINYFNRIIFGLQYQKFKFNPLFWFITLLLTGDVILTHFC